MKKTNLIICPNCRRQGRIEVLGEVNQLGHLLVMRFHKGMTTIIGSDFAVVCGKCGELTYIKKRKKINPYQWLLGVSRFSSIGTVMGTV